MTLERQQQDLDLWHQWQKKRDPEALDQLMTRMNPLIQREVNKWGGVVPVPALETKARVLTLDALKSYNPRAGAAIGTHVTSRLRKLSRFVYPYQNIARLPENKQLLYNTFQVAENRLLDEHGREPTVDELADELGWSVKKVSDFRNTFARKELVESEGSGIGTTSPDSPMVDFFYHGLSPSDQTFFEDITGYGGKKVLNNTALMRKHNLTQGQLSYKKRQFVDKLLVIQKGSF